MKKLLAIIVALAVLLAVGLATLVLYNFPPPQGEADIPFEFDKGQVIIPLKVNGVPARALVDTGNTHPLVDVGFAKKAGIRSPGGAIYKINGVNAPVGRGVLFEIGDARIRSRKVGLPDFSILRESPSGQFDVIIGNELLLDYVVQLDFVDNRLGLHRRGTFSPPANVRPVALGQPRWGLITMPLRLNGVPVEAALIDSGFNGALSISDGLAGRLSLTGETLSSGLEATFPRNIIVRMGTVKSLEVGGVVLTDMPFATHPEGRPFDARLGVEVLSRFDVFLDVAGEKMWLAPNAHLARPPRRNLIGLSLTREGLIMHVARNSPAERAGLRAGRKIISVNGVEYDRLPRPAPMVKAGDRFDYGLDDGSTARVTAAPYY